MKNDVILNQYMGGYMEYQKLLLGDEPYCIAYVKASYPQHCHNEIELIYCVRGHLKVIVEDAEYFVEEGSVLFVDSLSMHQLIFEEDAAILDIEFGAQFLGSFFHEFSKSIFSMPLLTPQDTVGYGPLVMKLLQKIYHEYMNPDQASVWAMRGYLNELFALMIREMPRAISQSGLRQHKLDKYLRIQRVFDFVKSHYGQPISLSMAAQHAGYDPNAFCRLFKGITNMSFHQYLNFYRINIAMHLLEYKDYTIGEIGQQVGIPVAKTFGRVFKMYTGMSPREYRRRIYDEIGAC
ncbi:MAG: AraC family transcriptional regulator [Ruminococcaceae bacterium]|nr:AraC family transcriptional regulator [Oscillospiraceae bacterium]